MNDSEPLAALLDSIPLISSAVQDGLAIAPASCMQKKLTTIAAAKDYAKFAASSPALPTGA